MILPDLVPYSKTFEMIRPGLLKCKNAEEVLHFFNRKFENIEWKLINNVEEIDEDGNSVGVISGFFEPRELKIFIEAGTSFYKGFCDEDEIDQLIMVALSIIGHELTHKEQFNRRMQKKYKKSKYYKTGEAKKYLSIPEEIASYGWQIARELQDFGFDKRQAIKLIKFDHISASNISSALGMYSIIFEKIEKPFKRLLKTVAAHLENIDE